MNQAPLVLGINGAQDASVCLMRGSQLVWAVQKERLTRQPRHRGCSGDLAAIYKPRLPELELPLDVLVESHAADATPGAFEAELAATLALAPGCRRALLSRHLAHVYSVFHPSPFARAAVMVINGHGSQVADFTEHWRGSAAVPGHWHEVASFYHADRERITCIDKQVWNRDQQQLVGLGMFYFLLTQAIFPGHGNQAKVMQLAPHGNPGALGLPPLHVEAWQVTLPAAWRNILRESARFCYGAPGAARFSDSAALAAAGQRAFEDALVKVAHWLHRQTGADALCLAGGSALNCMANQRLLRDTPFKRLCVAPAPGAAGTALGCALYGLTELARLPCDYRWQANYLGPQPAAAAIDAALAAAPDLLVERPPELCARVCELLCQGKVLGLFQGRSESARARWATAASWPTRATPTCATGSTPGSSCANGSVRFPRLCCSNTPAATSIFPSRRRSCNTRRRCTPKRRPACRPWAMAAAPRACKPWAPTTIPSCAACC
jgi:carbamoyltransferase